jgi:hypothetical protein
VLRTLPEKFLWWFAFNQVRLLPEKLLTGRFRLYIDAEMATPGPAVQSKVHQ